MKRVTTKSTLLKKLREVESSALRLQVYISRYTEISRRKSFDLIQQGGVTVDGAVEYEPSRSIIPGQVRVCIGRRVITVRQYIYIMLNKPNGVVTTKADRFASKTVYDLLPQKYQHLSAVGRLDKNTEGLLIFTNDGDLAHQLMHPRFNLDKTYEVHIRGRLTVKALKAIEKGFILDGQCTAPARIDRQQELKEGARFYLSIHEGRKRQIRLMMRHWGLQVIFLKRWNQGPLKLGTLKTGQWRMLAAAEISALKCLQV